MDHFTQPEEIQIDRFGFHYFHNNEEYSINKAKYRLQQLSATKAKWLILKSCWPRNSRRFHTDRKKAEIPPDH